MTISKSSWLGLAALIGCCAPLMVGCGSSGGGGIALTPPSLVPPGGEPTPGVVDPGLLQATFNGAITRSFQDSAGVMEFNLALLADGVPQALDPGGLSFSVQSVTDLRGIPLPVSVSLVPTQIQPPSPALAGEPLAMTILMDGSGSLFVTDRRDRRFLAAFGLLEQFRSLPLDFGSILRFDNQQTGFGATALGQPLQTAQLLQDFTSDQAALQRGILLSTPGGNTALYDASLDAAQVLSDFRQDEDLNRRLVVFTDGIDNDSRLRLTEAIAGIQRLPNGSRTGFSTYIVGLGTDLDLIELQQLAESTQGTFALAKIPEELGSPFANLFPAAIGENRVEVRVESTSSLAPGNYLLSGSLQINQDEASVTATFRDAVLVVR